MRFSHCFFICFIFAFFGCNKSKKAIILDDKKDSVAFYLRNAEDSKLSFEERKNFGNKALSILIKQPNDSLNRENIFKVSYNFFNINEWESLKKVAKIGYKRACDVEDLDHLAKAQRNLGLYFESISQNDSAFLYYVKAEKIYKKLQNPKGISLTYRDKAQVQYYVNDYTSGEITLIQAIKVARTFNIIDEQFYILNFIGVLSTELHDFETANRFYQKAAQILEYYPEIFRKVDKVQIFSNIAYNFDKWGQLEKAVLFYDKIFDNNYLKVESPNLYARILDNYGHALFKLGRYNQVSELYFETSRIRNLNHIDHGKNYNRLFLSEYYAAIKDTAKALSFAKEAVSLSKSFRNSGDILVSLKQLSKVDPKNALQYTQEYIQISDSMQLLERQTRNKFAKIAYETEEITQEKEAAVKKNWIISAIASGIILVLVLLLIIKMQRAKQKRLQLQQIQQKANEEIYNLLLDQQNKIDLGRNIEKKRVAQDLHDGIMNRLASTRLNLHNIAENPSFENIKKCLPFIDGIQSIEKEIRNIAHDLNKDVLSNKVSFVAIIESFIKEQEALSACKFHLEIDASIKWELIAGYKKIHLFRIIQESIQNIHKHAAAKSVIVSILKKEEALLLEIFDDGIGFSLNKKKKGIGLQNIFSRAKSCNGNAEIKSKEGIGTTIIIRLPI